MGHTGLCNWLAKIPGEPRGVNCRVNCLWSSDLWLRVDIFTGPPWCFTRRPILAKEGDYSPLTPSVEPNTVYLECICLT